GLDLLAEEPADHRLLVKNCRMTHEGAAFTLLPHLGRDAGNGTELAVAAGAVSHGGHPANLVQGLSRCGLCHDGLHYTRGPPRRGPLSMVTRSPPRRRAGACRRRPARRPGTRRRTRPRRTGRPPRTRARGRCRRPTARRAAPGARPPTRPAGGSRAP